MFEYIYNGGITKSMLRIEGVGPGITRSSPVLVTSLHTCHRLATARRRCSPPGDLQYDPTQALSILHADVAGVAAGLGGGAGGLLEPLNERVESEGLREGGVGVGAGVVLLVALRGVLHIILILALLSAFISADSRRRRRGGLASCRSSISGRRVRAGVSGRSRGGLAGGSGGNRGRRVGALTVVIGPLVRAATINSEVNAGLVVWSIISGASQNHWSTQSPALVQSPSRLSGRVMLKAVLLASTPALAA